MAIFCQECGKEIGGDVKFCPSCGTQIKKPEHSDANDEIQTGIHDKKISSVADIENPMPASSGKRFLNFIVDIISIYILTYIIGFIFGAVGLGDSLQNFIANDSYLFGILVYLAFYIFFEGIWQRTPGKYVTKTKVVDKDGQKPDFANIIGRSLCRCIPFEPFSFFGNYPTGWHDTISKTFVVPIEYTPADVQKMILTKNDKKQK